MNYPLLALRTLQKPLYHPTGQGHLRRVAYLAQCNHRPSKLPFKTNARAECTTAEKYVEADVDQHFEDWLTSRNVPYICHDSLSVLPSAPVQLLAFDLDDSLVVVVTTQGNVVATKKVAKFYNVPARLCHSISPDIAAKRCGCTNDILLMLSHSPTIPVCIDSSLAAHTSLFSPSSEAATYVEIKLLDVLKFPHVTMCDMSPDKSKVLQGSSEGLLSWSSQQSGLVKMKAVVSHRRRMGQQVVLAGLVPIETALSSSKSSYPRQVWQHPDSDAACEVHIVLGKPLASRIGEVAFKTQMRKLKPCSVISIIARTNPPSPQDEPSSSTIQLTSPLELVCEHFEILHPNIGAASNTRRHVARNDLVSLLSLLHVEPEPPVASKRARRKALTPECVKRRNTVYRLPLAESEVVVVDTLVGIHAMHSELCQRDIDVDSVQVERRVLSDVTAVGMDAEWQPYNRGEDATPVSILQLATSDKAWIIDMLVLCRSVRMNREDREAEGCDASDSGQTDQVNLDWRQTHKHLENLAPEETALSHFFSDFFASKRILKLGFVFHNDLHQLVNSYPHLTCFHYLPMRVRRPSFGVILPERSKILSFAASAKAMIEADAAAQVASTDNDPSTPNMAADDTDSAERASSIGDFHLREYLDLHYMLTVCRPDLRWRLKRASLKSIVDILLGQQLDKSEQTSEWAVRPLTASQIEYAANDAHVLAVMYDTLIASSVCSVSVYDVSEWGGGVELLKVLYGRKESCFFPTESGEKEWHVWQSFVR